MLRNVSRKYIAAVLLLSLWQPCLSLAYEDHCDERLKKNDQDPLAYKMRDHRCEGIYIKQVATSSLLSIASFTRAFEHYDLSTGNPLLVEWALPVANKDIRLRARSLKRKLYYQMDSHQPGDVNSFSWPIEFLSQKQIASNSLGIIGSVNIAIAHSSRKILIPLRVKQTETPLTDKYQLIVVPNVKLSEIYISIADTNQAGELGNFIIDEKPLAYGYYPAGRAIEYTLPELDASGVYYLEIAAVISSGGSSTLKSWFYYQRD